jgi:hypothetical protein
MLRRMKLPLPTPSCAAALFSIVLAACGGGGPGSSPAKTAPTAAAEQPQPEPQAPAPPFTDLFVLGNSITKIGPSAARGWSGDWGMAASSADKDFAHLTAAALHVPLTVLNFSALEIDPAVQVSQVLSYVQAATPHTAVVVELGDNVIAGGASTFAPAYGALLDAMHFAKLACVSTWWRDDAKDAVIQQACKAHGGTYVFIGDIYPQRTDDVNRYADVDTDRHPHDASMALIAARVTAALQH